MNLYNTTIRLSQRGQRLNSWDSFKRYLKISGWWWRDIQHLYLRIEFPVLDFQFWANRVHIGHLSIQQIGMLITLGEVENRRPVPSNIFWGHLRQWPNQFVVGPISCLVSKGIDCKDTKWFPTEIVPWKAITGGCQLLPPHLPAGLWLSCFRKL